MTLSLEQRIATLTPEKRALLEQRLQQNQSTMESRTKTITRRNSDQRIPLSFSQQRLWFLDQLYPGANTFNTTSAYRIKGELNLVALQQSLDELVNRHESLRTTYKLDEGEAIQIINQPTSLPLQIVELTAVTADAHDAAIQRWTALENQRVFDLSTDLMRHVTLLRFSDLKHVLLVTSHHIASDGWSNSIFWRELSELYAAFVKGDPSPFPQLPLQYADYAIWQRANLQGEKLATQLAYWKHQLAGAPASLNLPFDFPRPSEHSNAGKSWHFSVSQTTSQKLVRLSREANSTLYMSLLAAFQLLLMRYTNQQDILVGSAIANRQRPEIEGLIGMFVNTLVLRTDLSGNPSFVELLQRVRTVTLAAYTHQDLPFEKLVEELQPERLLGIHPLFQVALSFNNTPTAHYTLAGCEVERLSFESETTKYDLAVAFTQTGSGLLGRIEYNSALFAQPTIERMATHFTTLLTSIVENPDSPIEQLPLLSAVEINQLKIDWNDTARDFPVEKTIHQLFEEQVLCTPTAIAVHADDEKLTYQELNQRANQLAYHLRTLGVRPEVPVALCLERTSQMLVSLLAVLKAGGAYVPLDPSHPDERIRRLLGDIGAPILLTTASVAAQLADFPIHKIVLEQEQPWQNQVCSDNLERYATSANLAYILYTSGSTGRPKGVMIEHRQVVNYIFAMLEECVPPGSSCAMLQPLTVDSSVTMLFPPLVTGGTLHFIAYETALSGNALSRYFQQHPIDCLKIAPSHLAALQRDVNPMQIIPGKSLIIGGESSQLSWLENLQGLSHSCQIFNHYGPTETTVGVSTYRVSPFENEKRHVSAPLGKPLGNTKLYNLDRHMQPQPIGVAGELYIGGDAVGRGYLNRPELTEERFLPNPFADGMLYRTGDLVRYLADGNLEFLGRNDQQVKIRGFRIELGEIEATLVEHPSVAAAIVIVQTSQSGEQILIAYVVLKSLQAETPLVSEVTIAIRNDLQSKLPQYMCPTAVVALDDLPRTAHGKIDRQALSQLRHEVARNAQPEPARDDLERQLVEIWETVLKVESIGICDNFFDLGGHSLLAVQLFDQIAKLTGCTLPLATLFQTPTISALADALKQQDWAPNWKAVVPIRPEGSLPPLFVIPPGASTVLRFAPMLNHLDADLPIYGLQHRGLEDENPPFTSVAEIAEHFVEAILSIQPTGPYLLTGICFGAHVAFEIAQRLRTRGATIALLAVIDASPPANGPDWNFSPLKMTRIDWHLERLRMIRQGGAWIGIGIHYLKALKRRLRGLSRKELSHKDIRQIHRNAQITYQADYYAGSCILLQSEEYARREYIARYWKTLISGRFETYVIPGSTHSSLLVSKYHLRLMADALMKSIRQSLAES